MPQIKLNADAIIAEHGAIYKDNGQGYKDIIRAFTQNDETSEVFDDKRFIADDKAEFIRLEGHETVGIQIFQKGFTPSNAEAKFVPNGIVMTHFKMDEKWSPDDLAVGYMGFVDELPKVERLNWSFNRWFFNEFLAPGAIQYLENKLIYKGINDGNVVVPGTAKLAHEGFNGIGKLIDTNVANGKITPITIGAGQTPPADPLDFVKWVSEFCLNLPDEYSDNVQYLNMSKNLAKRFIQGIDKKNDYYVRQDDFLTVPLSPHIKVRGVTVNGTTRGGLASMKGVDDRVWTTTKKNAVMIRSVGRDMNSIEFQAIDREIKLLADWRMGVGFKSYKEIFTNK